MSKKNKQKQDIITESEYIFKLILDHANDLITIINENLEFEYVNENAYLEILGYSKEEILRTKVLDPIHPDDKKKAIKYFRESFKQCEDRVEIRVKHKNSQYLWLENKGKIFIDKEGKKKIILVSRDITERKKTEKIIKEEYKKLEELSKIKSEIIMLASHEFKTPLSSIYGAAQFLLTNFKSDFSTKSLELIEIIYKESQKLKQLIENLLDVSKVEAGKLNLSLKEENLVKIIKKCCVDLKYWVDKRNLKVIFDLPKEMIINIDKIRFIQVLINLISNAIKYTPPKGKIYITLKEKDDFINLSIKDTGIGITNKEKKLLFQKFGKVKRSNNEIDNEFEGSGLGLYISKEIVELHKGKIFVDSRGRKKGTTFMIRLPKFNQ